MPPTNMPPPGGWGQSIGQSVLASATDTHYHHTYKQLLLRLQCNPVLILSSISSGTGKSHALRQASEQLVQAKQLIFIPSAYTATGLHPSLEYAYRNGGTVVVSDTTPGNLDLSLHFASQLNSGNPCLGLDQPVRPEQHPAFHYIVEVTTRGAGYSHFSPQLYNPALRALTLKFEHDDMLFNNLLTETFPGNKAYEAYLKLVNGLTSSERGNLHLLKLISCFPPEDRSECLRSLLTEDDQTITPEQEISLAIISAYKGGKSKPKANQHAPSPASETDSPAVQQQHFINVVESFELPPVPTVVAAADPAQVITPDFGF